MSAAPQIGWKPPAGDLAAPGAPAAWKPPAADVDAAKDKPGFWSGLGEVLGDFAKNGPSQFMDFISGHPLRQIAEHGHELGDQAKDAFSKGDYQTGIGKTLASFLPGTGDQAIAAGEHIGQGIGGGDSAETGRGFGHAILALAPFLREPATRAGGAIAEAGAPLAEATKAGIRAGGPDVVAGAAKAGAGALAAEVLPAGPLRYVAGAAPVYAGTRQAMRGLGKGAAAFRESLSGKIAAVETAQPADMGLLNDLARGQAGRDFAHLTAEEQIQIRQLAARMDQTAAPQPGTPSTPAPGPPQAAPPAAVPPQAGPPAAQPSAPVIPAAGKTVADLIREEYEAKQAALQPPAPAPGPMIGAHKANPPAPRGAPLRPPLQSSSPGNAALQDVPPALPAAPATTAAGNATLQDMMASVPPATRGAAADANYRAVKESAPAAPAGAVYESAARQNKAEALAKVIHQAGIPLEDARLMDEGNWGDVSKHLGIKKPSKQTQAAALFELRKLELAAKAGSIKNPAARTLAEQLAEEMRRTGTIEP